MILINDNKTYNIAAMKFGIGIETFCNGTMGPAGVVGAKVFVDGEHVGYLYDEGDGYYSFNVENSHYDVAELNVRIDAILAMEGKESNRHNRYMFWHGLIESTYRYRKE